MPSLLPGQKYSDHFCLKTAASYELRITSHIWHVVIIREKCILLNKRLSLQTILQTMRHEKMPLRVLKKKNNALTLPCEETIVEKKV